MPETYQSIPQETPQTTDFNADISSELSIPGPNSAPELDVRSIETKRSLFYRAGYAVGKLVLKGNAKVDNFKFPLVNKPFTHEDLTTDMVALRNEMTTRTNLPTAEEEAIDRNRLKYREYIEADELSPTLMMRLSEIDTSTRDIPITTQSGEVITEGEYIERFKKDLSSNPEYVEKMQWLGENELVQALKEQAGWLIGRVLAGEQVVVAGEAWNRKGVKSGDFISKLIVGAAKDELDKMGIDSAGKIINLEDVPEGATDVADRVVMFDDWVGSGHDMRQRSRRTLKLAAEMGIDPKNVTVNLLAAQSRLLEEGFNGYSYPGEDDPNLKVITPYIIENTTDNYFPPFSGVHSDMDYSFSLQEEMKEATAKRSNNEVGIISSYHIQSMDTLGDSRFYNRIADKVRLGQTVDK